MNTRQLSKKIRVRQMSLDRQAINRNKHSQISPQSTNHDNSLILEQPELHRANKRKRNEQYGSLLKQMITVNRIEEEAEADKTRRTEMEDASYCRQKYPFGFEGVKVCEGVIEKYKASNYVIQKNMLQQFEREAEEFRRNRINRHRSPPTPHPQTLPHFTERLTNMDNSSFLKAEEQARRLRLHQLELMREELRRQEQQRRQKQYQRQIKRKKKNQFYMWQEKENLVKVGSMLREIDHKLKENSSKLASGLKQLRKQLISQTEFNHASQKNLLKIAKRITEQNQSCSRIPVVMYNSQLDNSRIHHQEADFAPRIDRGAFGQSSQHMNDVIRLLRKNEQRLEMLTEDYQLMK